MKHFYLILVLFILLAPATQASTHLWFWVNGDTANVITQGDFFAWEIDVATPGNRVDFKIYLDLDASRDVSTGDILLQQFDMSDGEFREDEPSDSSAVPDGIIYFQIGPFGFGAGDYLITAVDADGSEISGWLATDAAASITHKQIENTVRPIIGTLFPFKRPTVCGGDSPACGWLRRRL